MFRLQEITAMKLKCISVEQKALEEALLRGHEVEASKCRAAIDSLKREAMNPKAVLESLERFMGVADA